MKSFFYRAYRILHWSNVIFLGLFCVPAFLLFIINLIDGIPTRIEQFYYLMVPFFMLSIFLGIHIKLKKSAKRLDFSKIDSFLIFLLIILLVVSIRFLLIVFNPISLQGGGGILICPLRTIGQTRTEGRT